MGITEREYMQDNEPPEVVPETVRAETEQEAAKLLKFACPTRDAYGNWHRTTIAVSNVPVIELYNILSNANFVARRLHEIASRVGGVNGDLIMREAVKIEGLRMLLKQRDEGGTAVTQADVESLFRGANIHTRDSK